MYRLPRRSARTSAYAAASPAKNRATPGHRSAAKGAPSAQPRYTSQISGFKNMETKEPSDSPHTAKKAGARRRTSRRPIHLEQSTSPAKNPTARQAYSANTAGSCRQ